MPRSLPPAPRRGGRPPEVLKLSGPSDLVQAIPYLVGFRPRDSVVVVALRGDRHRVVLTVRVDLGSQTEATLTPVWSSVAEQGASEVLISVHDDVVTGRPLPWRELVDALTAAANASGLRVVDALGVGAERFWSYRCELPECCPVEGRPVDPAGVVAAELVLRGVGQVERREDLAAELAADDDRAQRVANAVDRLPDPAGSLRARQRAGMALLDSLVTARSAVPLDDETAAAVLVALLDLWVRDTQLVRRRGREQERATRLWTDLVAAAPAGLRAAPLVLLALARFRRGEGARANVALEAAARDQVGYGLAELIEQAITAAWSPAMIDATLDEGAREVRRLLGPGSGGGRQPRGAVSA